MATVCFAFDFHVATIEGQCPFDSRVNSFSNTVNINELKGHFHVLVYHILGNECVCLMNARM